MTDADGGISTPSRPRRSEDDIYASVRALVARQRAGEPGSTELRALPDTLTGIQVQDHKQDIGLKKTYAYWLLGAVVFQLVAADAVFVAYAWEGKDWDLDAAVINVWLTATLIQAIGVVAIVTRYLFPRRDASASPSSQG